MKDRYFLVAGLILLVTLGATLLLYPRLPGTVPVHWNIHGQVDRYGSKWEGLLLIPAVMAGLMLLMAALPWLSPKKYEVNGTRPGYLEMMIVLLVFFAYVHLALLTVDAGRHLNASKAVLGGVCAMFAAVGPVLPRLPRNFYVGVRTPWTLASEQVWQATHRFAAKTFLIGGLAGLVLAFAVRVPWAPFVALGAAGLAPVIHSLVYYKQLERRGEV